MIRLPAPSDAPPADAPPTDAPRAGPPPAARGRARVAVIAVHGVADQRPRESANAVAALLAGVRPGGYAAFAAESVRLALAPVRPRDAAAHAPPASRHLFDERLGVARRLVIDGVAPSGGDPRDDPHDAPSGRLADAAMADQLAAYDATRREPTFETRRLAARRAPAAAGEAEVDVHVYEAYWADLSRLRQGALRFVAELYQLLLHLGSLGRQTTDAAAAEWRTPGWRAAARAYAWAVRVLTLPIALGNLVLLVAVFAALPAARLPAGARGEVAVALAVALGAALGGAAAWAWARRRNARRPGRARAPGRASWVLAPALGAGAAGAAVSALVRADPGWGGVALAGAWWLLGAALLAPAVRRYQQLRPGAVAVGAALYAAAVAAFAYGAARAPGGVGAAGGDGAVAAGVLAASRLLYGVQRAAWIAFVSLALLAGALRWAAGRRVRGARARARLRDVATTARLALAVPALGFLSLTLFVWSGVYALERRWLGLYAGTPTEDWFRDTLGRSAGPGFVVVLALAAACLALLVLALAPSVADEVRPPRAGHASGDAAGARTLGRWLDVGLGLAEPVSGVAWAAAFGVLAAFFVADTAVQLGLRTPWVVALLDATGLASLGVLERAGTLVLAAAALLVALRAVLATASSALDVLLDVDNYLRNGPRGAAPRARIAERYASLLRHVAGEGYDEVVVVAHSLGAVVTADLFRFLRRAAREPALAPLGLDGTGRPGAVRLALFTMGCPLRQLFGRFFPHLYGWARGDLGDAAAAGAPPGQPLPLAGPLGVAEWVNVYRSGDYVGRVLWREAAGDPRDPYDRGAGPPGDVLAWEGAGCREGCIGRGAHTHYWDETAPDVGAILDGMLARAAARAGARRDA